jgi:hypothetical protein
LREGECVREAVRGGEREGCGGVSRSGGGEADPRELRRTESERESARREDREGRSAANPSNCACNTTCNTCNTCLGPRESEGRQRASSREGECKKKPSESGSESGEGTPATPATRQQQQQDKREEEAEAAGASAARAGGGGAEGGGSVGGGDWEVVPAPACVKGPCSGPPRLPVTLFSRRGRASECADVC